MYSRIKEILYHILPKKFIHKIEYPARYFNYLFYKGENFQCNICEKRIRSLITLNNDEICPRCGSLQRTRRLWEYLNDKFNLADLKILDFSPSRSFYRAMKNKSKNYVTSDLSGDFISDESYDITDINCHDNSFDLIICYHILEHIPNDIQAMKELYRVLKPGGFCIIQTPFKDGENYENYEITDPNERTIHFGQWDHVRIYSVNGLKKRLEKIGFIVKDEIFQEEVDNYNGFSSDEIILNCIKPIS
nr:methyltransferase domain-containing protein [uncultured Carboxylicivirga sp.]